jgi:hypothetical protein
MALDPSAIGTVTEPRVYEWTDRDTMLYALGVGAGIADLAFTTENSHDIPQQVLPTFAVICCMGFTAAPLIGTFNAGMLLHGSQEIRLSAPLPAAGALSVVAEVADIQDKGEGKNAVVMLRARGSDPAVANELIVVGAHYDHVGYGNSGNSYGPFGFVHNGADDNASGVAGLIELAEAMQHLPGRPRRPILFAFWDGEEKGLLGSYHFVRVRPAMLAQMSVAFSVNLDMIGRLRGERLEVFGARTSEGLRAAVVQSNNRPGARPLELAFDWAIDEDSDHYPFIAASIPTVMFHTGLHEQYHRPSDDVHLVNFDGIEPVARLTLDFVLALANEPGPVRSFRSQARSESDATKRALEAPAVSPAATQAGESQGRPVGNQRPRWGIGTRADPGEPANPVIVRITRESPAAQGGLMLGDRVLAVDGAAVTDQADMVTRLAAAGNRVALDVDRRGRVTRIVMNAMDAIPVMDAVQP